MACSPGASSDAGGHECTVGFLGNPANAPSAELLVLHADDTVVPVHDGDTVPMIFPPQGGRVIFIGVLATNVDGCALQLTGSLKDEASGLVTLDSRTIDLIPTGDGGGASSAPNEPLSAAISNFSNITVCANNWSTTDVYGHRYELAVTIRDRRGRQLTQKIHVVPECGEPARLQECLCICKANYVMGEACPDAGAGASADAGVDAGDAGDGE
jgi:hypothetical protein